MENSEDIVIDSHLTYSEITELIHTGSSISLKNDLNGRMVIGVVSSVYFVNCELYLHIYSFFSRTDKIYKLQKNCTVLSLKDILSEEKRNSVINYDFNEDAADWIGKWRSWGTRFILICVIIGMLFGGFDISFLFKNVDYGYDIFLKKKFTLFQLADTVNKRMIYTYDLSDVWNNPSFAWANRTGDCEEYAAIISSYLKKHKIENYIVGLSLKNRGNNGHAAVFARYKNAWWIIDPLRAAEPDIVKRFSTAKTLADVIACYSPLPVMIYQIPEFNGEKRYIGRIEKK